MASSNVGAEQSSQLSLSKLPIAEEPTPKQYETFMETVQARLEFIADKLANVEERQSSTGNCENDAIRFSDHWCRGESASLASQSLETVANLIRAGHEPTYIEQFLGKDLRRCEHMLWLLFEIIEGDRAWLASGEAYSTGTCLEKST